MAKKDKILSIEETLLNCTTPLMDVPLPKDKCAKNNTNIAEENLEIFDH